MNTSIIMRTSRASYSLKTDTKTSYIFQSGTNLLPHTLSFIDVLSTPQSIVAKGGAVKQMRGTFTRHEESPYKMNKPYKINTAIWPVSGYDNLYYGTLGISGSRGRIERNNGDLVVIRTSDWAQVEVFIVKGCSNRAELNPDFLQNVASYVSCM